LKVLQGRFVYVFPDLSKDGSTFIDWEAKAKYFERQLPATRFVVSDLLEQLAPDKDRNEGSDIADFLIKQDWRKFRKLNIQKQTRQPEPQKGEAGEAEKTKIFSQTKLKVEVLGNDQEQPENWSSDIVEMESYFAGITLPTQPIKLNDCSIINDCSLFIESHIGTLKTNNGKRTFLPYLSRLKELRGIISLNDDWNMTNDEFFNSLLFKVVF